MIKIVYLWIVLFAFSAGAAFSSMLWDSKAGDRAFLITAMIGCLLIAIVIAEDHSKDE